MVTIAAAVALASAFLLVHDPGGLIEPAYLEATTTTTAAAPAVHTTPRRNEPGPPPPPIMADGIWDRLAACETGGNWQANTGNGYSGGLQFSADTWARAGGRAYAPAAWQASREQQIAVAAAWLARTSWAQWPACSRRLGLR